jgi:hypothetical protein
MTIDEYAPLILLAAGVAVIIIEAVLRRLNREKIQGD